ncbi:uncharacterized protein BDW43DRAFT_303054 [Aspergillus alliaceus]|uniref:uncharacterized protein n=1 Tax=Petromyces alliaceus TaxID=209559 RepID=UPI0012A61B07|nr:uncharacterized protein BDW43DRAFT_303054 [Aspergillus alliaceus]KAB8229463.1 hypothetical protein BDW43DRAFT_303054 [Aspergillus alliaceus]
MPDLNVNVLCSVPGYTVPDPDRVNEKITSSNTNFNRGGVKIAKLSPDIVRSEEYDICRNHRGYTGPKDFACYFYGPRRPDVEEHGSLFDPYIFMSYVKDGNYISAAGLGPIIDRMEIYHIKDIQRSFVSEVAFNNITIEAYQTKAPKRHIKAILADLCLQNIIVHDGYVSEIVDCEIMANDTTDYLVQVLEPYYSQYAVHSFLTETLCRSEAFIH